MRILILSANTGGGHNSAASAIHDELDRRGVDNDIRDCLAFLSERASEFISWGHSFVYRKLPHVFGKAYEFEEKHPGPQIYDLMSLGADRFYEKVADEKYDAIICVHVFAAMLITEVKRRYVYSVPFYFVATDYTCSPGVSDISPRRWFIPDDGLIDEFVACGIPADRLLVTGIPVRREFYEPVKRGTACAALGLPQDKRVVLLCCGSMGCGHMERIAPQFEKRLPDDTLLVIICGRNEQTYERLAAVMGDRSIVVGYTERIALYMAAADVCITKPGGLTVTELMTVGLPSVLMLAVPGCETRNLDYLCSRSLAVGATDWDEAFAQTVHLLEDQPRLNAMRESLANLKMPHAAARMADYVLEAPTAAK